MTDALIGRNGLGKALIRLAILGPHVLVAPMVQLFEELKEEDAQVVRFFFAGAVDDG
jgi:hypothetical protein